MSDPAVAELLRERTYLWRAIDLLVQEVGTRAGISQWFRDEWTKLVEERGRHFDTPREPEGGK